MSRGWWLHWRAMPVLLDHVLFAVLAVGLPLFAFVFVHLPLDRASPEALPRFRARTYGLIMLLEWGLVALLAGLWTGARRDWGDLGLAAGRGWLGLLVWVLVPLGAALLIAQGRTLVSQPDHWEAVRTRVRHIWRVLPASDREMRTFFGVSATAGICEELLYRGFAIHYLSLWMPVPLAALAASVAFGVGHAYQGPRGVLTTGLLGLLFAALYLASRTLWPVVLLHALLDANSGWVTYQIASRHGPGWVWEEPPAGAGETAPGAASALEGVGIEPAVPGQGPSPGAEEADQRPAGASPGSSDGAIQP